MRSFRLLLLVIIAAMALTAQDKPAPTTNETEAAIIPVKNLSGDSFKRLISLLNVFKAQFNADERLRIIVVYAPKPVVEQMRKVITELDKPGSDASVGRNIEMEMTLLRCPTTAPANAPPLPAAMEPVAKQLRAASLCKNVQVWDTIPIHLQEGKPSVSDSVLQMDYPPDNSARATQRTQVHVESVITRPSGRYVRFEKFEVTLRVPAFTKSSVTFSGTGINTSGEFKEGQKAVLGKISGAETDSGVFVVISLKIVE